MKTEGDFIQISDTLWARKSDVVSVGWDIGNEWLEIWLSSRRQKVLIQNRAKVRAILEALNLDQLWQRIERQLEAVENPNLNPILEDKCGVLPAS
jgi:hypothetical protein